MSLNKIINIFLFGLFLSLSLVIFSNSKINNLHSEVYAAAPAGSPEADTGNAFSFYATPDPTDIYDNKLSSNDNISICEVASGTCTLAEALNGDGGNITTFIPNGQTGSGTYTWVGTTVKEGDAQVTITVNDSNPTLATYQVNGGTSYAISVSGYQAALAGLAAGTQVGALSGVLSYGATITGSAQSVSVTAEVDNSIPATDVGGTAGPISFTLSQNNKVVFTQASNTATITNSQISTGTFPEADFSATFTTNVAPGTYQLCSPDLTATCNNVTVTNNSVSGSTDLTGGGLNAAGLKTLAPPNTSAAKVDPCDSSGFSLSWLVCPVITVLQDAVGAAQTAIQNQLNVPVDNYFSDTCTQAAGDTDPANADGCNTSDVNQMIWSNIRDLALSLLVIAALIMVMATALDIGPFDAYTVKKVLPRILIAVFAITFSWQIGRFLVQLSDDVGVGVGQLIYDAAGISQADILKNIGDGLLVWLGIGGAVGAGAALLAVAVVGPLALLMLLLPVLLGIAIAFLTLILRRLIIVICVVFSPIAFIAFVLPGTQKIWKLWKDSFVGALFLFPMITAVIAIGGVLAYLTTQGNTGSSFIAPFTGLLLYILPFFLIPKLVRISSGAMGSLSTVVGHASKGGFAALKKSRQNQWASRRERSKVGGLWNGDRNKVTGFLSGLAVGVGTGARGHYGVGGVGTEAKSRNLLAGVAEKMKDPGFVQATFDDDLRYALEVGNKDRAKADLIAKHITGKGLTAAQQADKMAEINKSVNGAEAIGFNSQTRLAAFKAEAPNKSRNIADTEAANKMIHNIALATGVNEGDLRDSYSYDARSNSRFDLGALDGKEQQYAVGTAAYNKALDAQTMKGWAKGSLYQHANSVPTSIENVSEAFTRSGSDLEYGVFTKELSAVRQNATGAVAGASIQAEQKMMAGHTASGITYTDLVTNPGVAVPDYSVPVAPGAPVATKSGRAPGKITYVEVTKQDPLNPGTTITERVAQQQRVDTVANQEMDRLARVYNRDPNLDP